MISHVSNHPLVKATTTFIIGNVTGTMLLWESFLIIDILWGSMFFVGLFNVLSVPFYIPMMFISFFWDIFLWYGAYYNLYTSVYYFNYYFYMGIIFFIYWLFLPLGFLQGLFFGIPSALFSAIGYYSYSNLTGNYWTLANWAILSNFNI